MFTTNLLKPFLTFSLLALTLLPQISGSGSAFAAKQPIAKFPTPPSLAVPSTCLSVVNSSISQCSYSDDFKSAWRASCIHGQL